MSQDLVGQLRELEAEGARAIGAAGGGEGVVVGKVDDGLAGAAVGGDEPPGQPGRDGRAAVAVGAGGPPDRDRRRRVTGDEVGEGAAVSVVVERGARVLQVGALRVGLGVGVGGVVGVVRRVRIHVAVGSAPRREALTSPYPIL